MKSFLRGTTALAGIVIAGSAFAADLPRRAAPPVFVPVPVFTWTGAYFGINAGYGFDAGSNSDRYNLPAGSVLNGGPVNRVFNANSSNDLERLRRRWSGRLQLPVHPGFGRGRRYRS